MTNQELFEQFDNINRTQDNILDKYTELAAIKNYKTTEFYKKTKKSIYEAFAIYMDNEGKIINITNILADPVKIDLLLQRIVKIFDVEQYMDQLTPDNKELLKEMFKNI